MYLLDRVSQLSRYRRSIKLKHWGRKLLLLIFKMQTYLSDYIDVSPIVIEEEIVDFIRNSKIEFR